MPVLSYDNVFYINLNVAISVFFCKMSIHVVIQNGRQRTCENHILAHNFAPISPRDLILMAKHMFCGSMKTMEYK